CSRGGDPFSGSPSIKYDRSGTCVMSAPAFFASLQPQGALFQGSPEPASPLLGVWFFLGLWVVLGLVCGAASAYIAVTRGLPPIPWFFRGLAVNLVALGWVRTRAPADPSVFPQGVPRGLRKVPSTRAPLPCPRCGEENHPSARACATCRGALDPRVDAETVRA